MKQKCITCQVIFKIYVSSQFVLVVYRVLVKRRHHRPLVSHYIHLDQY